MQYAGLLTGSQLGPVAHTPPSIRGPLAQHVGARLEDAHGTFIRGEGGYFWEKGFLGGVIDFVRNMETLEVSLQARSQCAWLGS